jgi:hypothetical protein
VIMIDGNMGPPERLDGMKTERPADKNRAESAAHPADPALTRAPDPRAPAQTSGAAKENLHCPQALREAAGRLLEEGAIDASRDGVVRPSRVDEARQKFEAGTFDRRDVLARIVDRLIEQWRL